MVPGRRLETNNFIFYSRSHFTNDLPRSPETSVCLSIFAQSSHSIRSFRDNTRDQRDMCNFHFFHLYLKLGYYLGIVPYKIHFDNALGHHKIVKVNLFQKVFTYFLNNICLRRLATNFSVYKSSCWNIIIIYICKL